MPDTPSPPPGNDSPPVDNSPHGGNSPHGDNSPPGAASAPLDLRTALALREDPGLQPERTALAWQRTAVSFFAASLLILRWVETLGIIAVAMVLLSGLAAGWTIWHTRARLRHASRVFPEAPVEIAALDVAVTITALLTLAGLGVWTVLATT